MHVRNAWNYYRLLQSVGARKQNSEFGQVSLIHEHYLFLPVLPHRRQGCQIYHRTVHLEKHAWLRLAEANKQCLQTLPLATCRSFPTWVLRKSLKMVRCIAEGCLVAQSQEVPSTFILYKRCPLQLCNIGGVVSLRCRCKLEGNKHLYGVWGKNSWLCHRWFWHGKTSEYLEIQFWQGYKYSLRLAPLPFLLLTNVVPILLL